MDRNIAIVMESLEKNGFKVEFFENREDMKNRILSEIDLSETVGFGGSVSATKDTGIYSKLKERGNRIFYHSTVKTPEEKDAMFRGAVLSDVYITSVNAITLSGELVNIDATGNRLAAMLSPTHNRVYVIAGKNKIVKNYEAALLRIKNIVAPKNSERLGFNNPCAKIGKCMDCKSDKRICNATLVQNRQMFFGNTIIYLVNESMGY